LPTAAAEVAIDLRTASDDARNSGYDRNEPAQDYLSNDLH